jgi:hemolysin activation/secretion protein
VVGRLGLEDKRLTDEFGVRSDKRLQGASAGLTFESRDALWGGGFTGGSVGLHIGRLKESAYADPSTIGSFGKATLQLSRLQSLSPRFAVFVGVGGQLSNHNLDSAEKMTLGGAKGVRAYPAAEAASDEAVMLNAELRYFVNAQWSTFAFHDAAKGHVQKSPYTLSGNTRILHASGLGLQYTNPQLLTLKATFGVRGAAPVVSDTDNGRSLFLLQLQHAF